MPELLLATSNAGKVREYRVLLDGLGYGMVTLPEKGIGQSVAESGLTYEENARLKAVTNASLSRLITLADDSGLEVDALDGAPGVQSARFAGESATDAERVNLLLARLRGVPWARRTARFKCVIVIAGTGGYLATCHGQCEGLIALDARGEAGFGYDPVFYLPDLGKTMAELPPGVKNQISHRARACQEARQVLMQLRT